MSGWSEPARFEVELDRTSGWHASWIGQGRVRESVTPPSGAGPVDPVARALTPAPYLRRAFTVDQPVASARLYVTALGLYEARLNGRRVGDGFLTPGWTDYTQRIPYQTYDVTGLLAEGENVLGAILAHGWYAGFYGFDAKRAGAHYGTAPELLAQLLIAYRRQPRVDRHRRAVAVLGRRDPARGPADGRAARPRARASRLGHARLRRLGLAAGPVRDRDATPLVADPGPPVRVTEEIAPRSIATDDHGRHIVDFGQNLTGWLRINVDGPPGTRVRIRHGEVLAADGSLYTDNLRTARADRRVHHRRRRRGARTAVHPARVPVRRDHRLPRRHRPGRHRRPGGPLRHARGREPSSPRCRGWTSCSATSTGVSGATSSACRPTARSATSGSAGSATPRSSPAPPATTATSRRSSASGWTTWPTPSCPPAPSPTSPRGSTSARAPGHRPGATPG